MISAENKAAYLKNKYGNEAATQARQILWMSPVYSKPYWMNVIDYLNDK